MAASGSGKKTKGRQKIEMKKIENDDDRLISFSKRRAGIYKKASELSTLCGAEVGFVVNSPAGKPYSFGHPSIESVANRFLSQSPPPNDNTHPLVEAHRKVKCNQLSQQLNNVLSQLDAEKQKAKALNQMAQGRKTCGWWNVPIDQCHGKELDQLYSCHEKFCKELYSHMNKTSVGATSSQLAPMNPAYLANPFTSNANDQVPASFPPGYSHGRKQF